MNSSKTNTPKSLTTKKAPLNPVVRNAQVKISQPRHNTKSGPLFKVKSTIIKPATTIKPPQKEFPKLVWEDFKGKPKEGSWFLAHSYWKIVYSYNVKNNQDHVKISVNAKCIFEKERAWVKSDAKSQTLLEHEQGHYYIGCLCALVFQKRVQEAIFSIGKENYQVELRNIFQKTFCEYLNLEKKYDEETKHYMDQEMQADWDKKIITQINDLRQYWWI